jgi:CSLREA domain-containing protein
LFESRALLTTITVTSLADNLNDDGQTTLREAIAQADSQPSHDDIVFADGLDGVISLSLGPLEIGNSDLSITGNGRDATVIDGGGSGTVFNDADFETTSTLRSMTIQNADHGVAARVGDQGYGGGGEFLIDDAIITGHSGTGVSFSGIRYVNNGGADIVNASIRDTTISGNGANGINFRLGLHGFVRDSIIEENTGGGVFSGEFGYMGDWYFAPRVTISGTQIRNNSHAQGSGGGITHTAGALRVEASSITGNTAKHGGGIFTAAGGDDRTDGGEQRQALHLLGSTVSDNAATHRGGGLAAVWSETRISNSTISGNTAKHGGGVFFDNQVSDEFGFDETSSELHMYNTTVTDNSAATRGGAFFRKADLETNFVSSILAGNHAPVGSDMAFPVSATTGHVLFEHNLLGSNEDTPFTSTGAIPDADGNVIGSAADPIDPAISSLTEFGILEVHVPNSNSPALERGSNPLALTEDQTGQNRVVGTSADIGAVEGTPNILPLSISATPGIDGGDVTSVTFTFTLDAATDQSFTFDVNTANGTAIAGSDFAALSQTLNFDGTQGESQQVSVLVLNDIFVEETETLAVRLSNLSLPLSLPPDVEGEIQDRDADTSIHIRGSRLVVVGTDEDDVIRFDREGSAIEVTLNDETIDVPTDGIDAIDVQANDGNDNVIARSIDVRMSVVGGNGNDTLKGGSHSDTLRGGPGDDVLRGLAGNDSLVGGQGNDFLRGQDGSDWVHGDDGDDTLDGADGHDKLFGDGGNDVMEGGSGDDYILGQADDDTITGGVGKDRLRGGIGNDFVSGGSGNDSIRGDKGNDTLLGSSGRDTLVGDQGRDWLDGGSGNDSLNGNAGADVLAGAEGDDSIAGEAGLDVIVGGAGADILSGGDGEDILIGGSLTPDTGLTTITHLAALHDEWLSANTYGVRHKNLRNHNPKDDRLNLTYLTGIDGDQPNVFDDGAIDQLQGNADRDLFFAKLGEDLLDRDTTEFVENL